MHQVHFLGDIRQVQRFFDRGIAAANHRDHLVAVEETIAGGTRRYAFAGKRLFGRQAQVLSRCPCGDNQCVTGVGTAVAFQGERARLQLSSVDVVVDDLGFKALGMLLHALHQRWAGQAFDITRPVVHFGSGGQLTTGLNASNDHRLEVGAGSVNGSAITGRAGAQDDQA